MDSDDYGYDISRFHNTLSDQFVCPICTAVARDPKECTVCGALFCSKCVDSWMQKKKECPRGRCDIVKNPIKKVTGALRNIYNNLDVKCKFPNCQKHLKLVDLDQHEAICQMPKCYNYDVCQNHVKPDFKDKGVCDISCLLLHKIRSTNGNWQQALNEIKVFLKDFEQQPSVGFIVPKPGAVTTFKWDRVAVGSGIEITNNGMNVFLQEQQYMFRTVLGDTAFYGGIQYWEIVADERTENELKIGVATKKDFNYNSAFCDYDFGYSYYGLGQLRHNSNAAGPQYGKRFKKEGVLGVCLDMNKGTLSFALNGEYWGVAFSNPALKKGPIYPAVSLLHCAGCKLQTGKAVPAYFLK